MDIRRISDVSKTQHVQTSGFVSGRRLLVFTISSAVVLFMAQVGCKRLRTSNITGGTNGRSTHKPFFQLDVHARMTLLDAAARIHIGDTEGKVEQLLGPPTYESRFCPRRGPDLREIHSLKYYITMFEEGLVNEIEDEYIEVDIVAGGGVRNIYYRLRTLANGGSDNHAGRNR